MSGLLSDSVSSACRSAARSPHLSWFPGLGALARHVACLAAVEAVPAATAAATAARLSGFLWLSAVARHVSRLPAVEAVSAAAAATAARLSGLPWLLALTGHVSGLAAVEAAAAAAAATTAASPAVGPPALLAPADSDLPAAELRAVQVLDGLLGVLLVVEVDKGEAALYGC